MAEQSNAVARDDSMVSQSHSFYLMKAEPDSRIVKGKDVRFGVDDFETAKTTAWEGVRNYEARNLMQEMKLGDKVLFYHSNTKNPGIAAFAEVSKEAYPDHTAWDKTHPYYDPKSDASSPRWHMVDLRFVSRVTHFVPLSLLRHLASLTSPPEKIANLAAEDLKAIKAMALLNKGRLSVQQVDKEAWNAVGKLAKDGAGGLAFKGAMRMDKVITSGSRNKGINNTDEGNEDEADISNSGRGKGTPKRKVMAASREVEGTRRSKRMKK